MLAPSLLLLLAFASIAPQRSPPLDPKVWLSPARDFAVLVDPTARDGSGPGHYRMTHEDVVVWRREHPFTLQTALVTGAGIVYGYAYTAGRDSAHGSLQVIRLDRDGTARVLSERDRHAPTHRHGPPGPRCASIDLEPMRDRVVVTIADPPATEVYHALSGEFLGFDSRRGPRDAVPRYAPRERERETAWDRPLDPRAHPSSSGAWVLHVDPVRRDGAGSAEYRLTHGGDLVWSGRRPFALREAHVGDDGVVHGAALIEGNGTEHGALELWRIEPNGESRLLAERRRRQSRRVHGGPTPACIGIASIAKSGEPSKVGFWIVDADEGTIVDFVSATSGERMGTVSADDVQVWPWREDAEGSRGEPRPLPPIELVHRGEIDMREASRAIDTIGAFAIDAHGRAYATDSCMQTLHAFDPDGASVFVRTVPPGSVDVARAWLLRLGVGGDGRILLQERLHGTGLFFGPDGQPLGPLSRDADRRTGRAYLHPRGEDRWTVGYDTVAPHDALGERMAIGMHRSSGRWLGRLGAAAIGPDGSIFVVDTREDLPDRERAQIQAITPDGAPAMAYGLDASTWYGDQMVCSWQWLVLESHPKLELIALASGERFSFEPAEDRKERHTFHVSPDGDELWIALLASRRIARYALPRTR